MSGRALVLAAHGSNRIPSVNRAMEALAAAIGARLMFDEVIAAFYQGSPRFCEVLDRVQSSDVTVVPILAARGHYADTVLPRELALNASYPHRTVSITGPVGGHWKLVELFADRIEALQRQLPRMRGALRIGVIGHGTARHPESRTTTLRIAESLRRRIHGGDVHAAFIDDHPPIESLTEGIDRDLLVIPFLMSHGPHAVQDVPRRLGFTHAGRLTEPVQRYVDNRLIVCDRPIGMDLAMADIILDLAVESAGRQAAPIALKSESSAVLRLGTRNSPMAMWQANHVQALLSRRGVDSELVPFATSGDRDRSRAIHRLESDSPFTDDIDRALRHGEIDLAVHAYKDLPAVTPRDLCDAAVVPRSDAREALVARQGWTLSTLPSGARVGTSSPRRRAQLLLLRKDLEPVTMRGPVDERVQQVQDGRFDAAVLAVAGLQRLGLEAEITQHFAVEAFVPAPAQGALIVQTRGDDHRTCAMVEALDDKNTRTACRIERGLLAEFAADGDLILAAHATCGRTNCLIVRLLNETGAVTCQLRLKDVNADALLSGAIAALRHGAHRTEHVA